MGVDLTPAPPAWRRGPRAAGAAAAARPRRPEAGPADARRPGTSLRGRPVAQTLQRAAALMPALGISRVTDITRLDFLGLPVCASVRPRGRTLRVHAGKGVRPEDARVGALMEAVEFAVAEAASARGADRRIGTQDWLAQLPAGLQLADFCPLLGVLQAPPSLAAVECENLLDGGAALLPAALVLVPWRNDDEVELFRWTSNGLACGNTLAEATLHALLEVLERDALAMETARRQAVRVLPHTLPLPWRALQARWRRGGVELLVRHVPNDFGLACFEAHLHEAASTDVNLTAGSGLHPDRGIALARAISEAAQSRLSLIHGGRDDVTRFFGKYGAFEPGARMAGEERLLALLRDDRGAVACTELPHRRYTTASGALRGVLQGLRRRGYAQVYRRRMDLPDGALRRAGLHVVKVVVPRCEALHPGGVQAGPRLMGALLQRG